MSDKSKPHLGDSVVVIGLGRFGLSLAKELLESGHEVLAIDSDADLVQELASELPNVVQADTTEMTALRQLSVTDFSHAVVCIGANLEASVLTILNLTQMGVSDIWAKANSQQHGRIAQRVGAHHVVLPEADMGKRLAHMVTGKMIEFIEFDDVFAIAKTRAPMETHNKKFAESNIRQKYGITVVGIKRRNMDFIYAQAESEILPSDHLVVAGPTDLIKVFAAKF